MPAQSGDPISSALQISLNKDSEKKGSADLLALLSCSASHSRISDIDYEQYHYDSSSFLVGLKSKYIVLSEKDCQDDQSEKSSSLNSGSKTVTNLFKSNSCDKLQVTNNNKTNTSDKLNGSDKGNGLDRPDKSNYPKLPSPEKVLWPQDSIVAGWKSNFPVGSGLINVGNSCYFNSTLQALFHIPSFVNWLLMENSHSCAKSYINSECLICACAMTLKSSQENTGKAIKPYLIYSRLKSICKQLNPGYQEDAHEFLRHLVDSLDRTYLITYKGMKLDHLSKETTPLSRIFGGYLRNEVVCQSCQHVSTTFQYFQDMPLDIRSASHLDSALEMFFAKESLTEHEGYVCESCKKKVPFTKKFSLEKPPCVLCIQLKRFGAMSGKNNKAVGISTRLNLNKFRSVKGGEAFDCYELVAVVNHIGTSTNCGHYTAVAKAADSKYYLFDDHRVDSLHDVTQYSSHSYILLYEQQKKKSPEVVNGLKPDVSFVKGNNFKSSSSVISQSCSNALKSMKDKCLVKNELKSPPYKLLITTMKNSTSIPMSQDTDLSVEKKTDDKCNRLTAQDNNSDDEKESTKRIVNGISHSTCDDLTKSLVPYNESSSSESDSSSSSREASRCGSPETVNGIRNESSEAVTVNGKTFPSPSSRESSKDRPISNSSKESNHESNGINSPSPKKHNSLHNHGGSIGNGTKVNGNNNSIRYSSWIEKGWRVTSNHVENHHKSHQVSTSNHHGGSSSGSHSAPPSSTHFNKNNNGWKVNSSSSLDRSEFRSKFNNMNHRGYGKPVLSWSGKISEMESEVNQENFVNKRRSTNHSDFETPIKKMKKFNGSGGGNGGHKFDTNNKNKFQEMQKRRNWIYGGGGGNKGNRDWMYNRDYHRPRQHQFQWYNNHHG